MERVYNSYNEKLLATGQLGSLFARYAIPGAVGLVFFSLQSIIDGIIVGNYLGADALASVSLIVPSYSLMTAVAIIIGIGSQAQMNIAMGERNYAKTKSALKTGLLSIFVFSLVFCAFINLFAVSIAGFLGAEGSLLESSVKYIRGVMPFITPIACFYFFDYTLKALGHPRLAMSIMISSILLNVALSILFVTRLNLGIFGVGLATGLSMLIGCSVSAFIVFKRIQSEKSLANVKGHFSWRLLGRIFYNGSSEGVSEIAMGITLFIFNLTLMQYAGKEGVAGFSVINYIIFIGTSIFLGISDGIISILSFNYGAKLWTRIKGTVRIAIRTNFLIGVIFLTFLWLYGESVISLFLDESDQAVIDLAATGSKIMALSFLVNGFNIFSASFFTAIDNAKLSLIIASLRGLIFVVAGIVVLPGLLGVNGIWLCVSLAELLTAVIAIIMIRQTIKKQ